MSRTPDVPPEREAQRRAAVRMALALGALAVVIYVWAIVARV